VDGQLTKPQESVPMAPPVEVAAKDATQEAPKQEQNPLSGFEKKGDNADGFGTNIAKFVEGSKPVHGEGRGYQKCPADPERRCQHAEDRTGRSRNRDRSCRSSRCGRGFSSDNKFGTMNIGPTAVDARWSNYGVYLQRMIETVQIQWGSHFALEHDLSAFRHDRDRELPHGFRRQDHGDH